MVVRVRGSRMPVAKSPGRLHPVSSHITLAGVHVTQLAARILRCLIRFSEILCTPGSSSIIDRMRRISFGNRTKEITNKF